MPAMASAVGATAGRRSSALPWGRQSCAGEAPPCYRMSLRRRSSASVPGPDDSSATRGPTPSQAASPITEQSRAQRIKESLQMWNKETELKNLSELGKMRIFAGEKSSKRSRDRDVDMLVRLARLPPG